MCLLAFADLGTQHVFLPLLVGYSTTLKIHLTTMNLVVVKRFHVVPTTSISLKKEQNSLSLQAICSSEYYMLAFLASQLIFKLI